MMSVLSIIFAFVATCTFGFTAVIAFLIGMSAFNAYREHTLREGEAWQFALFSAGSFSLVAIYSFADYIIWIWALA